MAAMAAPISGPTQKIHCRKQPSTARCSTKCASERKHKNKYLIVPCLVLPVNHGSPKAPCRVYSGSGDRDRGQVDHEHGKPNGKWRQDLVDKNKSADNLCRQACAGAVAGRQRVCASTISRVAFTNPHPHMAPKHCATIYSTARMRDTFWAKNSPNVTAGCAVNEYEDHAAKGPSNTENADSTTLIGCTLDSVTDHRQNRNI
ncbi:MiaB-like protein [Striga asiatica]|uniref:MiaB-like protein n=1 Tax=Striga asiatica TaxID=4170 RepID=A0A5A7P826_STRAF|nr:MiaB-like protein [Striga asiatica]